ncbi:DUF4940 domain-containing protein [Pseudothermotoga thermarum]|uniref:Uncharacterized protein n=1 Tax=Pseudothermotoga thermarum DSM 5069 TaxID=688269 RepID=F7YYU5_9THEM|nr:DUF4940 domain-containing protein [Pseudothermotoga thermarum]AEH51135.1 hypothetical protein Theth_1055 [Pseudothermotoga thermarum DSM 5069]
MKLFIAKSMEVLHNDFDFNFLEHPAFFTLYECDVPILLRIEGYQMQFVKLNTLFGPVIVGFDKEEFPIQALQSHVEKLLMAKKSYPENISKISDLVGDWKGERVIGILETEDLQDRMEYRVSLSKFAIDVVNLGKKDLYAFPTADISVGFDCRLSLSMPSSDKLEAIRQACVVDRYAVFKGTLSYDKLLYHDSFSIHLDEEDVPFIESKLLFRDYEKLARKFSIRKEEVFQRQMQLEQKYWLFFENFVDEYLYNFALRKRVMKQ